MISTTTVLYDGIHWTLDVEIEPGEPEYGFEETVEVVGVKVFGSEMIEYLADHHIERLKEIALDAWRQADEQAQIDDYEWRKAA